MPRVSGRTAKVFAQTGAGTLYPNTLLTDSGDHRKFTSGQTLWGDIPAPVIRINGARSGLEVTIDNAAANDTVDVTAGTCYLAGVLVSVAAGSLATIARPLVAGQLVITAITVDSAGALAKVAGTEGAAGGARGAAGGPPFIPVGSIQLAEVTLSTTAAAVIAASAIDNTPAERSDTPGTDINFFDGEVDMQIPLPAIHTATVARRVYATFRKVDLQEIADLSEVKLDLGKDTAATMGFGDRFKKAVPTLRDWSGSGRGFVTSPYWFDLANRDGYALLKFRHHEDAQFEFEGIANVKWGMNVPSTDAVTEEISFTGNGELKKIAV